MPGLLFFEVIELIFGLSRSVSRALGKQLEIFAIILLLAVFYRMHYRLPIPENSEQRQSFIMVKKSLSLMLFFVFMSIGVYSLVNLYAMGITLAYNLHVQGSDKQG